MFKFLIPFSFFVGFAEAQLHSFVTYPAYVFRAGVAEGGPLAIPYPRVVDFYTSLDIKSSLTDGRLGVQEFINLLKLHPSCAVYIIQTDSFVGQHNVTNLAVSGCVEYVKNNDTYWLYFTHKWQLDADGNINSLESIIPLDR